MNSSMTDIIASGQCFDCNNSISSRCTESQLFGSPALNGAQAKFVSSVALCVCRPTDD